MALSRKRIGETYAEDESAADRKPAGAKSTDSEHPEETICPAECDESEEKRRAPGFDHSLRRACDGTKRVIGKRPSGPDQKTGSERCEGEARKSIRQEALVEVVGEEYAGKHRCQSCAHEQCECEQTRAQPAQEDG